MGFFRNQKTEIKDFLKKLQAREEKNRIIHLYGEDTGNSIIKLKLEFLNKQKYKIETEIQRLNDFIYSNEPQRKNEPRRLNDFIYSNEPQRKNDFFYSNNTQQ